jgi:hypothetical protein
VREAVCSAACYFKFTFDQLAVAVLVARIGQSLTHMAFPETNVSVGIRFTFFAVQLFAMLWMAVLVAVNAAVDMH